MPLGAASTVRRVSPAEPARVIQGVGRRIAERRAQLDMTQDQLAEALGVSVQYVNRLEAGENLTIRSLVQIANLLGLTITELFEPPVSTERPKRGRPRRT